MEMLSEMLRRVVDHGATTAPDVGIHWIVNAKSKCGISIKGWHLHPDHEFTANLYASGGAVAVREPCGRWAEVTSYDVVKEENGDLKVSVKYEGGEGIAEIDNGEESEEFTAHFYPLPV